MTDLTERSQEKDYWGLWGRGPNPWNKTFWGKPYSKTALKWKTKSADQKDTLNTEIGKEKSVATRILLVILTKSRGKLDWSRTSRPSTILQEQCQAGSEEGKWGPRTSFLVKSSLRNRGNRHVMLKCERIQRI